VRERIGYDIYVYIYVYIYMYIYAYKYVYTFIYIHMYKYVYIYIYIYLYVCMHMCTCIYVIIYIYLQTYIDIFIVFIYMYMYHYKSHIRLFFNSLNHFVRTAQHSLLFEFGFLKKLMFELSYSNRVGKLLHKCFELLCSLQEAGFMYFTWDI
jgi:hypothetical protein